MCEYRLRVLVKPSRMILRGQNIPEEFEMSVSDVMTFEVKPGRVPDIMPLMKEVHQFAAKNGLPHARLFNTVVGGQGFLRRTVVIEHESMEAWAADGSKRTALADWPDMQRKIFGPDAPWTAVSRSLLMEVEVG